MAGLEAEPVLNPGDHPDRLEDLAGHRGQVAAAAQLRQGARVDLGVLPHLKRGQVEPERLGLPDQVLQLPVDCRTAPAAASDACTSRRSATNSAGPPYARSAFLVRVAASRSAA